MKTIRRDIPDKIVLNASGRKVDRDEGSASKSPSQFKPVSNKDMMKSIPFTISTQIGKR